MKLLLPLAFALFLTACVTPEDKNAAHQRQLEKEARENFMALKAQEHRTAPPAAPPQVARTESTNPAIHPQPFLPARTATTKPTKSTKPAKPTISFHSLFRVEPARRSDDTVYYWNVPRRTETPSAAYRAYERQYAHELAKRPEDLAPEEREWVRRHYQDPHFNHAL